MMRRQGGNAKVRYEFRSRLMQHYSSSPRNVLHQPLPNYIVVCVRTRMVSILHGRKQVSCLSRVPPAVCPSLLESATTVCNSFLQSLSTYQVRTYADSSFHITIQAHSTNTRFTYVQSYTFTTTCCSYHCCTDSPALKKKLSECL